MRRSPEAAVFNEAGKIGVVGAVSNITEFYAIYTSFWVGQNVTPTIQGHSSTRWPNIDDSKNYFNSGPKTNALLANLDYATYLPDCLMVKTDRASMKFGLELRSPFLDHNLLELYRGAGDQIVSSLPEKKSFKADPC